MPYCIWNQLHWFTAPVSVTVAFMLLAIEEIGALVAECGHSWTGGPQQQ
jgi:predicted membrane chloride channel (bestrophin family)